MTADDGLYGGVVPVLVATVFTSASFSVLISFIMSLYSSCVGSAATSIAMASTSARVGGPDMIGGSGSSKGGRGLGGSSRNGVEKRNRRIGDSVSGSGDSRFVSSSFPSSSGLRSILTLRSSSRREMIFLFR